MTIHAIDALRATSRRRFFDRAAVVVLAASATSILAAQEAEAYCGTPTGCYGLDGCGCHGGGCGTSAHGACCWTWTDTANCRSYACCDVTCADGKTGICRYYVGPMC